MLGVAAEEVTVEQKQAYEAKVRENYQLNKKIGILHGVVHYTALGFYYQMTVLTKFVFDLSGSSFLVGLVSSVGALAHQIPQLFASAMVEHLAEKKKMMLWFGVGARLPWLFMSLAILCLDREATLIASLTLYATATMFYAMYLLVWTDVMSKVIPLEYRGNYFGLRNFLASTATALAGLGAGKIVEMYYPTMIGYAVSFFLAFAVISLTFGFCQKRKKNLPCRSGKRQPFWKNWPRFPLCSGKTRISQSTVISGQSPVLSIWDSRSTSFTPSSVSNLPVSSRLPSSAFLLSSKSSDAQWGIFSGGLSPRKQATKYLLSRLV
jgi:hypothetical protein